MCLPQAPNPSDQSQPPVVHFFPASLFPLFFSSSFPLRFVFDLVGFRPVNTIWHPLVSPADSCIIAVSLSRRVFLSSTHFWASSFRPFPFCYIPIGGPGVVEVEDSQAFIFFFLLFLFFSFSPSCFLSHHGWVMSSYLLLLYSLCCILALLLSPLSPLLTNHCVLLPVPLSCRCLSSLPPLSLSPYLFFFSLFPPFPFSPPLSPIKKISDC